MDSVHGNPDLTCTKCVWFEDFNEQIEMTMVISVKICDKWPNQVYGWILCRLTEGGFNWAEIGLKAPKSERVSSSFNTLQFL